MADDVEQYRQIILAPGYDSQTSIFGLVCSTDNGQTFRVYWTPYGRVWYPEDASSFFPLLWPYIEEKIKAGGFKQDEVVNWSDIQGRPDVALKSDLPDLSKFAKISDIPKVDLSGYAKITDIPSDLVHTKDLADYVKTKDLPKPPDLSGYALKSQIPSLDGYAKLTDIPSLTGYLKQSALADYATKEDLKAIQLTPGPPGTPGADGKTSYFHIAYANSADGKDGFYVGGGTNLLTGTGKHTVTSTGPYTEGCLSNETTDDFLTLFKGLEGQTVTVSVDYEYSGFVAGSGWNRIGWETQINGNPVTYLGPWYYPTNDSGSGRISSTFVVPKNITGVYESLGYIQFSGSGTGTLSHLKLEKGSVATPWSPAPSEAHPLYMGTYTDFTQADSLDPTDYQWSQIKGDKGDRGPQGPPGQDATITIDSSSQTTNKKPSDYSEGIFHEVKDISSLGIDRTPADFAPEGRQGTTAFVTTMSYGGMAHQTADIVDSEKPMRFCRNGKGDTWYRWEWSTTD